MQTHTHTDVRCWCCTHHSRPPRCCLHSCCSESHTGCSEAYTGRSHTALHLACRMLHVLRICANMHIETHKHRQIWVQHKGQVLSSEYRKWGKCLHLVSQAKDLQHLASSRPSEQSFTLSHTFLRGTQRPSPQRNCRGQAGDTGKRLKYTVQCKGWYFNPG